MFTINSDKEVAPIYEGIPTLVEAKKLVIEYCIKNNAQGNITNTMGTQIYFGIMNNN